MQESVDDGFAVNTRLNRNVVMIIRVIAEIKVVMVYLDGGVAEVSSDTLHCVNALCIKVEELEIDSDTDREEKARESERVSEMCVRV